MRSIIDLPLAFTRLARVDWQIDWRGVAGGGDLAGGDQMVVDGFPRWVAQSEVVLPAPMIGAWRSVIDQLRGGVNVLRVRMIDPAVWQARAGAAWQSDWDAYQRGQFVEPRPLVPCAAGALAGASTITVDERGLSAPIAVGAVLSHGDWPFRVLGRSGSGAAVVLQVARVARAIPPGGQIDVLARGLFRVTDPAAANAGYDLARVARPSLSLAEWITRP